jgi:hypothetical protein
LGRVRRLVRAGDVLYAATRRGISILGIEEDGGASGIGGHVAWEDEFEQPTYALAPVGRHHLFCVRGSDMLLLDMAGHDQPRVVDRWDTIEQKWWVGDAVASGKRIYVAAENLGVLTLECDLS